MQTVVSTIKGVPDLRDVHVMSDLLRHLGAKVEFKDETLVVDATSINSYDAPYELVSRNESFIFDYGATTCEI